MTVWLIEPRDPLIVRDGRPFDNNPGARSVSLSFPFPSTLAGGVRTLVGTDPKTGKFQQDKETLRRVKEIGIRGPILAEVTERTPEVHWLFPAPLDAVTFSGLNNTIRIAPLSPMRFPDGTATDLDAVGLLPVGLEKPENEKPLPSAPRFWYWPYLNQWLIDPDSKSSTQDEIGIGSLARSVRSHVGIHSKTWVAEDGVIFQTVGLEFHSLQASGKRDALTSVRDFALTIETDADSLGGTTALGGERRLAHWQQSNQAWPECPPELIDRIVEEQACRVILATPAVFSGGYQPDWLCTCEAGVQVKISAAIVGRPQVVSGWDYDLRKPKPSRRLAPPGSVYFLKLNGSADAIRAWVNQIWLQNISDDEQSRLDGFGLALVGTWNGQPNNWRTENEA